MSEQKSTEAQRQPVNSEQPATDLDKLKLLADQIHGIEIPELSGDDGKRALSEANGHLYLAYMAVKKFIETKIVTTEEEF